MGQYRKLPVVVEARQLTMDVGEARQLAAWCSGEARLDYLGATTTPYVYIPTREGIMRADPGDWIVQGVAGEFYPCKPEIFEQTYEPAP